MVDTRQRALCSTCPEIYQLICEYEHDRNPWAMVPYKIQAYRNEALSANIWGPENATSSRIVEWAWECRQGNDTDVRQNIVLGSMQSTHESQAIAKWNLGAHHAQRPNLLGVRTRICLQRHDTDGKLQCTDLQNDLLPEQYVNSKCSTRENL